MQLKKYREKHGLFVAESGKVVADLMHVFECRWMLAATSWMATQGHIPTEELIVADDDDLRKASLLSTPSDVVALFRLPDCDDMTGADPTRQLVLALDGIQNPGNLGTIVRLADWLGIAHVVCSTDTAGALAHVNVHYTDLEAFLDKHRDTPVYGTFTEGDVIYDRHLSPNGVVVMGNEGNGIRPAVAACVSHKLSVPNYPETRETTESLNVATAAAIVCAEFRRQLRDKALQRPAHPAGKY